MTRTTCVYCNEELWGHLERNGVCLSCQAAELDEASDDYVENEMEMQDRWIAEDGA